MSFQCPGHSGELSKQKFLWGMCEPYLPVPARDFQWPRVVERIWPSAEGILFKAEVHTDTPLRSVERLQESLSVLGPQDRGEKNYEEYAIP
jgi:hypothetical protein